MWLTACASSEMNFLRAIILSIGLHARERFAPIMRRAAVEGVPCAALRATSPFALGSCAMTKNFWCSP